VTHSCLPASSVACDFVAEQVAQTGLATGDVAAPGRRRLFIFAIVSLALLMSSVDQTIVATALPALQRELHSQVNWSSWTITIYALGQVLMMPLAGKLGDQYGRKQVFLAAAAVFTVASLCCGLSRSIFLLIVFRAIQALGGGAFMPSATGIIAEIFGRDRDRAVGLFASIFPIGGMIGPVLGGLFVTYWSWRGIFLVNLPVGVALLVLGTIFIPDIARRPDRHLDVRGIVLVGVTLLSAMFGVAFVGSAGSDPLSLAFIAPECVAVAAAVAFVRHSARAESPFISLRFLTGPGFGAMNLINFLYGSAALGFAPLVPLYAQERYGLSSLAAGTLLTSRALGMIATAGLAVYLLRRTGYRWPIAIGFCLTAGGIIATAAGPPAAFSPYAWLAIGTGIVGAAMGTATPAANNATLQLAPDHAAAVAGLRGMFRQAGAISAVSVTAAIVARSSDPGIAQARVFLVFAAILIGAVGLVAFVPEHRGRW
jgi:EmrB/QacA subfamily drug resistance transporter